MLIRTDDVIDWGFAKVCLAIAKRVEPILKVVTDVRATFQGSSEGGTCGLCNDAHINVQVDHGAGGGWQEP